MRVSRQYLAMSMSLSFMLCSGWAGYANMGMDCISGYYDEYGISYDSDNGHVRYIYPSQL